MHACISSLALTATVSSSTQSSSVIKAIHAGEEILQVAVKVLEEVEGTSVGQAEPEDTDMQESGAFAAADE